MIEITTEKTLIASKLQKEHDENVRIWESMVANEHQSGKVAAVRVSFVAHGADKLPSFLRQVFVHGEHGFCDQFSGNHVTFGQFAYLEYLDIPVAGTYLARTVWPGDDEMADRFLCAGESLSHMSVINTDLERVTADVLSECIPLSLDEWKKEWGPVLLYLNELNQ